MLIIRDLAEEVKLLKIVQPSLCVRFPIQIRTEITNHKEKYVHIINIETWVLYITYLHIVVNTYLQSIMKTTIWPGQDKNYTFLTIDL